jgi:glycosyltransferase A (GT-A) superfamily protein (DUF2064 family)
MRLLKVGPESAGAAPGPACYALGGAEPTVTDADVVLGPVADGGYWLIGLRAARVDLFDRMPWGTASVYARTVAVLAATHTPWRALPLRHDIDEPADLMAHAAALRDLGRRVI